MKLFEWSKDGGPESTVSGFFIIEAKRFFSIAVLRFSNGSRDAYHTHAFNAVSIVWKGRLVEYLKNGLKVTYTPSLVPIITKRDTFHKVLSVGTTWVLTLRGPWVDCWEEHLPSTGKNLTLTHGRKEVGEQTANLT
jgi:hypothetical protein